MIYVCVYVHMYTYTYICHTCDDMHIIIYFSIRGFIFDRNFKACMEPSNPKTLTEFWREISFQAARCLLLK